MSSSLFNLNLSYFFTDILKKRCFLVLLIMVFGGGNIQLLLGQCTSATPINPTSNTPICEAGNALLFSAAGFVSYQWTGPNGFTASVQNPQLNSATVAAAGTYSVLGTDAGGCTASATVSLAVNVNVKVPAEIGFPESNCGAYTVQPLQVVIPALGGTGSLETVWMESTFGNILGMAAGGNSTSYSPGNINKTTYYRFCVRSQGCSEFKEGAIIKKEVLAAANVTASNAGPYCAGNSIQLTASTTDDNLITDGSFSSEVAGEFVHAYSAVAGEGNFYHTDNANSWGLGACTDHTSGSGKMLIFDGYSIPEIKAWEYGTPVLTNKTYTFSVWASSLSATNPASLKLTVNGVPINTAVTLSTTTCQWVQISATWNSGTNTSAKIAIINETGATLGNDFALDDIEFYTTGNFSWTGPNGFTSTSQNPMILASTLTQGGTYTVTYTKGNGCISVATTDVMVNDCPANCSNVVISTLPTICEADNLHLFASGGNTYNWAGPNGFSSTSQNPTLLNATSVHSGTYSVTITGDLACTASTSATVTVNPRPNAPSVSDANVCGYASANLTALGCAGGTLSWYLAGGNEILVGTGATYTTPILFEGTSYYVDCTENGCTSEQSTAHVLLNDVIAGIIADPSPNYCQQQTYDFAAQDAGPNATYLWDFGTDAVPLSATTLNVNGVYWTSTGTKTVTLTVTDNSNNCSETIVQLYNVLGAPTADVSITGATPTCLNGNVSLSTPTGVGFTYQWSEDGVVLMGETNNTYVVPTDSIGSHNYSVQVTNANGCAVIDSQRVEVITNIATTAYNDAPTCMGSEVHFTVLTATSYNWAGPNGFSATVQSPTITNATTAATGTYSVSITDVSGCTASTTTSVVVNGCGTLVNSCTLTDAHDVWAGFPSFPLAWAMGGVGETYVVDGGVSLQEYSNGNVIISGTLKGNGVPIVNPSGTDPNKKYAFSITLAQREDWATWSAGGGTPFYPLGQNPPYNTWAYYLMSTGSMIGLGTNNGHSLNLTHYPVDFSKGFQQGFGANFHGPENGIGGWTTFVRSSDNASAIGDFMFESTCACPSFSPSIEGNTYICSNGTTTLTATGANAFSWNTGETTASINISSAGIYSVIVSQEGCATNLTVSVERRGSIGDFVWNDEDKDGIQDASEKGIANVNVTLLNNGGEVVAASTTDAYGKYTFDCLVAGNYQVKFTLPIDYTFSAKTAGTNIALDSDVNPQTGITDFITLGIGENKTDIDAGVYYDTPTRTLIGDYVWLDANENGLQENGELGISGVRVGLYNNFNQLLMTTLTNSEGKYLFTNVAAGSYKIGITLPLGLTFTLPNEGANDEIDSDIDTATAKTFAFALIAGQEKRNMDIGLIPQNALKAYIGDFVWNDLDANGIQHIRETGVQGITVELWDDGGNLVRTTETDILGQYIFTNISQGFYVLRFTNLPVNWTISNRNQGSDDNLDSDARPSNGFTDTLKVNEGDRITNIDAGVYDINSVSTARIGNFVWYDANADGLQDADEIGVAGVNVTLYNFANIPIGNTTTNERGYYQFTGLSAGTYSVGFDNLPTNYIFAPQKTGSNTSIDSDVNRISGRTDNITLAANQNEISVDAGLQSNTDNGGYASVGDRVWNDTNNNGLQDNGELGVANVSIELYNASNASLIATTTSDAKGNYLFTTLSKGNYYLIFTNLPSGYTYSLVNQGTDNEIDSDAGVGGQTANFELTEGENNLTIDAGLNRAVTHNTLGDYVWNDVNQDGLQDVGEIGIAGIGVKLYDNSHVLIAATVTDEKGKYQFTNVSDGSYYLIFTDIPTAYTFTSKGGGGAATLDSDVNPTTGKTDIFSISGASTNNDLDAGLYSTTRSLLGDFVWADDGNGRQDVGEEGVSGITVRLYDGGQLVSQTVTNEKGFYLFSNLTAGTYTVSFVNLPQGATFARKNMASATADSDVNPATGITDAISLVAGHINLSIDAGILLPRVTKGMLCGDTWLDEDGDGLQGVGEKYIGGVVAYLIDAANNTLSATLTNASGRYCFTHVEEANYSVRFSNFPLGSVLTMPDAGNDNFDSDANTSTGISTNAYSVFSGQITEGPDAGVLPPASVAGKAFEDNGTTPNGLRDNGESTIAGVVVILYDENDVFIRSIRTDKNGAYIFTGLTAGNYKIGFGSVAGRTFTGQDAGNPNDDNFDSDVNILTGKTDVFSLVVNQNKENVDAGYLLMGVVFPVELRYFSAEWVNGDGLLKWGTANEVNISHFEVWRSLDEVSFERIIENLPAKGNGMNQNYKAFDYKVGAINADKVYYVLKMVDKDGKFATSKTIELMLLRNSPLIYLNIYPNPAQNDIWFDYQLFAAKQAEVMLVNATGEVVYKGVLQGAENVSQYHISIENFARGVYYLKLQTEDASAIDKVILD